MTAEQFCLRWNNHQRTLVSVFDGLFESGTLVDCTLAADGQYLKAHKVVLCACSPYLETLLSQHYNQHPIVILKDVKFEELQAVMEYMYRGEVNVTQEQLGHFLKAAEMLQVKGLTYSDNKVLGGSSAHIVSSKFSSGSVEGAKDAKSNDSKKKEKLLPAPATGSQNSLTDTLKLLPSNLVIDIPPISPVNSVKDGSVSPNPPPKRKKVLQSDVKSVKSCSSENSESATSNSKAAAAGHSKFVFDVDPMEIVNSQTIKLEESSEDSYDSDTLVVDEGKHLLEPGPSTAAAAVADGCNWHPAQGDEHPEATKGGGGVGLGGGRTIDEFLEYLALEPKGARKMAAPAAHLLHRRKLRKRKQLAVAAATEQQLQQQDKTVHTIQHPVKFKTTADKNKMAVIRKKIINYKHRANQLSVAAKKVAAKAKSEPKPATGTEAKENIGVKVVPASAIKQKIVKAAKIKAALKKSSTPHDKKGGKNKQTVVMSNNSTAKPNDKIYCCDKCDKAYSRKSSLYRHTTYECGKKHSFHCPNCTYGAFQKVHLNRHMLIVHRQAI